MAPRAWIVVAPGAPAERPVPINSRLLVGRECRGADPARRLILDDPMVSRDHLEIRLDTPQGPTLVDLSTNGTWVNGRRVERGEPSVVRDSDRIELGGHMLEFRVEGDVEPVADVLGLTHRATETTQLAIVVGDIVGYTRLTEAHGGVTVAAVVESLFSAIRDLVRAHHGTVGNYVGDAILAAWDAGRDPRAGERAIGFAVAAEALAVAAASGPDVRDPIRMGWAVALGEAGVSRPSPAHVSAHGDAVNLAFRLAGRAARDGRPTILATVEAAAAAPSAAYGEQFALEVKGRSAPAQVRPVLAASAPA